MPTSSSFDEITARRTLAAAFERVRSNGGCRGAGGMTVGDFAANREPEIDRLQNRLMTGRSRGSPPRSTSGPIASCARAPRGLSASGRLRGQLIPPQGRNVPLRMRQYDLAHSAAFCLGLAREIVLGKALNSIAVLKRFRGNHPEAVSAPEIEDLEGRVKGIEEAVSIAALRGLEGSFAARYFGVLPALFPDAMRFDSRSRRPPRDPVNALLSFGYVLVGNEIQSLLGAMGFDPYLGFYHALDYGRPSLALDLVEEFRAALVDRWSAGLLNLGMLKSEDFTRTAEGGVLLGRDGMRRYFPAYEKELTSPVSIADGEGQLTFRQLFRRQAERLARLLTDGEPYVSFQLPC